MNRCCYLCGKAIRIGKGKVGIFTCKESNLLWIDCNLCYECAINLQIEIEKIKT